MDFHVLLGWGLRGPVTWHSRRMDRFAKYDHAAKNTINSNCGHDSSFISRDRKEQSGGFDDASKKKRCVVGADDEAAIFEAQQWLP